MKKITFITILIVLIPFVVVSFLLKEKEIDFNLVTGNIYVRVKRVSSNVIDKVPLEEYVVGVVAGEVPATFDIEAIKAQAVAARTYALKRVDYNINNDYDVVDTVLNQVYLDIDYLKKRWGNEYVKKINKIRKAVAYTRGEVLLYENKLVDALFFSTSNGYTENSEDVFGFKLPYLRSVESAWDREASPVFDDQKTISTDEFYQLLSLPYNSNLTFEILKKTNTGRIVTLKINNKELNGRDVYSKLKIRSTDFNIVQNNNNIYIKTKGYGHGVGMSQYGANGMALKGYKYNQILKYYYKGIEIKKI
jgi:stage II sporulation protein D